MPVTALDAEALCGLGTFDEPAFGEVSDEAVALAALVSVEVAFETVFDAAEVVDETVFETAEPVDETVLPTADPVDETALLHR